MTMLARGYMEALAQSRGVRTLDVADLQYAARCAEMDAVAARYRHARPELDFSLSDGSDLGTWMRGANLVLLTGLLEGVLPTIYMTPVERRSTP
jgi:hypothetical protein